MSHSYPPHASKFDARALQDAMRKHLPPLRAGVEARATWIGGDSFEFGLIDPAKPWRERCLTGNFRTADMNQAEFWEATKEFAGQFAEMGRQRGLFDERPEAEADKADGFAKRDWASIESRLQAIEERLAACFSD